MNTAFYLVSALFVLAMIGLAFMAIRWGIRRDRAELSARAARADLPAGTARSTDDMSPGP